MFTEKTLRAEPGINGSSMADIAFLLLIFFLVTTTINIDTGIGMILPPPIEDNLAPIPKRNLMNILVNAEGDILMDDALVSVQDMNAVLTEFLMNYGVNPELSDSPEKAVISILTQAETPYRVYIDMLDEVMGTYNGIRNSESLSAFGSTFNRLSEEQQTVIKKRIPKRISIAEPD